MLLKIDQVQVNHNGFDQLLKCWEHPSILVLQSKRKLTKLSKSSYSLSPGPSPVSLRRESLTEPSLRWVALPSCVFNPWCSQARTIPFWHTSDSSFIDSGVLQRGLVAWLQARLCVQHRGGGAGGEGRGEDWQAAAGEQEKKQTKAGEQRARTCTWTAAQGWGSSASKASGLQQRRLPSCSCQAEQGEQG